MSEAAEIDQPKQSSVLLTQTFEYTATIGQLTYDLGPTGLAAWPDHLA